MTALPYTVFGNADVRLRVWFNDGTNGWQQLSPDQRIAAVGYAMTAANVPAGSITSTQLAANAVTSAKIANGAVGSAQLSSNIVTSGTLTAQVLAASSFVALPPTTSATTGVLAIGPSSFLSAYGLDNTFVGASAGNFTLSGTTNTAVGATALAGLTTGSGNTALGFAALNKDTLGTNNTASGYQALLNNVVGSLNSAYGSFALANNFAGTNNAAFGAYALYNNTNGVNGFGNSAFGYAALKGVIGTNNIAMGANAGSGLLVGNNNNNIDIGNTGSNFESSTIHLGTTGTQTNTYIAGIYGTGVGNSAAPVFINSAGQVGTVTTPAFGYMPTGGVVEYASTNAPNGFLPCFGESVPTSTYPNLFAVVGYTYGGSNAVFNVPLMTNTPTPQQIYIIKY